MGGEDDLKYIDLVNEIVPDSEDDLDDTNPANQIFPNTIKNIPLESPWSA